MDKDQVAVISAILALMLTYGVPAALKILKSLGTDNPTAEDIGALSGRVSHPDTYR